MNNAGFCEPSIRRIFLDIRFCCNGEIFLKFTFFYGNKVISMKICLEELLQLLSFSFHNFIVMSMNKPPLLQYVCYLNTSVA